jgi:OOP family OmpA-OmpF porin
MRQVCASLLILTRRTSMHQPRKWWIGLPVLAGVAMMANVVLVPSVEAGLTARARAALAQNPDAIDQATIAVDGRDVAIGGLAVGDRTRVFAQLRADPAIRTLTDVTASVSLASPFLLRIDRRGDVATVSGYTPLANARSRIADDLAALGLSVADKTVYARGAPANFATLTHFAAQQIAALDPAEISVDDATLSISGEARDDEAYEKTRAALQSPPEGVGAVRGAILPPRVAPYVFGAAIGPGVIALSGHLPDPELRRAAVAKAAALGHGAAVNDATRPGSGAPTGDYAAAVDAALDALSRLSQGKVAISDAKIAIEGEGRENIDSEAVLARVREKLPKGFEIARADIAAGPVAPYAFAATRDASGAVTLSGYAPDAPTHQRLAESARRYFPGAVLNDRIIVAKGAPVRYAEAVETSLAALARLAEGKVSIRGATVALAGVARSPQAQSDIGSAFPAGLPSGFSGETQLNARAPGAPLDPEACRAALAEASRATFVFVADDTEIAPESAPAFDALAETVLRCAGTTIEIGVHTDTTGIAEINRDRSRRQARAIAERLVKAGADPLRLAPVGYGADRPIAANDSSESRARNRRIEFAVK